VPPAQVRLDCDAVFGAIQGNQAFTTLVPPPTIGGAPGAPPGVVAPKSASGNAGGSSPTSEARP
jgi:hypothetical protein